MQRLLSLEKRRLPTALRRNHRLLPSQGTERHLVFPVNALLAHNVGEQAAF